MKQRMLLLILMALLSLTGLMSAQDGYAEQDVIDMVAAQPPFSYGLLTMPGWTAAAYDTRNAYGIWRVQFWNADGDEIGWANVNPVQQRMYDYEGPFESTDEQLRKAEPIVREFITTHPDVIALLGDPSNFADSTYVGYNGWVSAWGVWIERGPDSLYLLVQFDELNPDALENPRLLQISFPNVMSYGEWQENMTGEATAIAFAQPEVAAALRGITGWESSAARGEDGLWQVTFSDNDTELVSATVNLETRQIVDWALP